MMQQDELSRAQTPTAPKRRRNRSQSTLLKTMPQLPSTAYYKHQAISDDAAALFAKRLPIAVRVNNSSPCAALCTATLTMRPAPAAGTYFVDAASELLAAFQEIGALARQELVSCIPPALPGCEVRRRRRRSVRRAGHEGPAAARRRRWRRPCGCVGGRPEAARRPRGARRSTSKGAFSIVRGRATLSGLRPVRKSNFGRPTP